MFETGLADSIDNIITTYNALIFIEVNYKELKDVEKDVYTSRCVVTMKVDKTRTVTITEECYECYIRKASFVVIYDCVGEAKGA